MARSMFPSTMKTNNMEKEKLGTPTEMSTKVIGKTERAMVTAFTLT